MTREVDQAVVVAGGFATRMAHLFPRQAKATYLIGGRPMLHYLLEWICLQGLTEVHLCLGYLSEQVLRAYPLGLPLRVSYTLEQVPLGVAGALKYATSFLAPRFVLLYGDVLPRTPLPKLLPYFDKNYDAQLTVCNAMLGDEAPNIALERGMVINYGGGPFATHLDVGLTVMSKGALTNVGVDEFVSGPALFRTLAASRRLAAHEVTIPSLETGSPRGYARALAELGQ